MRHNITTKAGNTLSFFYNPENNLLVVDLIHKSENGGNEIIRTTLKEKMLLKHCNTKKRDCADEIGECDERGYVITKGRGRFSLLEV